MIVLPIVLLIIIILAIALAPKGGEEVVREVQVPVVQTEYVEKESKPPLTCQEYEFFYSEGYTCITKDCAALSTESNPLYLDTDGDCRSQCKDSSLYFEDSSSNKCLLKETKCT